MSDERLRALERTAVQSGSRADIEAWLTEAAREGHPAGAAWRAFAAEITEAEFRRQEEIEAAEREEEVFSTQYRYGRHVPTSGNLTQHRHGRTAQSERLTATGRAFLDALPPSRAAGWALQMSPLEDFVKRTGRVAYGYAVALLNAGDVRSPTVLDRPPACMSVLRGGRRPCHGIASATLLFTAPALGAAHVCAAHVRLDGVEHLFQTTATSLWEEWAAGDVVRCTYYRSQASQRLRAGLDGHAVLLHSTARFPVLQPAAEACGRRMLQLIWGRSS